MKDSNNGLIASEGETHSDPVIASRRGGSNRWKRAYCYRTPASEACCSMDGCPAHQSVRQKDSHWLLYTRTWQTNSSCLARRRERGCRNLFVLPVWFSGRGIETWAQSLFWGEKLSGLRGMKAMKLIIQRVLLLQNALSFDYLLFQVIFHGIFIE